MEPEMEGSEQQQDAPQPASRLSRPSQPQAPPTPAAGRPPSAGSPPASGPPPVSGPTRAASASQPPSAPIPQPVKSSPLGKIAAVLVLAGALYFGYNYTQHHNPGGGETISAPGSPSGGMLAAETQSPNYQKNKNAKPGTPMNLAAADINQQATDAAVAAAESGKPIPGLDSVSAGLLESIKKHEVKFITVRAYDSCAEDGDWVTLSTDAGSKIGSFMLTIVGRTIVIPVVNGQLPQMTLTGDRDGVGGITVGIESSTGTWYSGVLAPGESQPIPLAMQ
jgi:hypothetical protein